VSKVIPLLLAAGLSMPTGTGGKEVFIGTDLAGLKEDARKRSEMEKANKPSKRKMKKKRGNHDQQRID